MTAIAPEQAPSHALAHDGATSSTAQAPHPVLLHTLRPSAEQQQHEKQIQAARRDSEPQDINQHPLLSSEHFLDIIHSNFVRPHLSTLVHSKSFFARQKARSKDVHVPSGPQASAFATIFNLCKAMIGSGILGLAFSMRYTGLVPALFVILFLLCINAYTCTLLARLVDITGCVSFFDIAGSAFGKVGVTIACWIMFFNQLGSLGFEHPTQATRNTIMVIVAVLSILPLAMRRSLNELRFTSFIAVLCYFFLAVASSYKLEVLSHGPNYELGIAGGYNFFTIFPIMAYAVACTPTAVTIYVEMKDRKEWTKCIMWATLIMSACYCWVASVSYSTFGTSAKGNYILTYEIDGLILVVCFTFMFTVLISYAVQHFTLRIALGYLLVGERELHDIMYYIVTILVFVAVVIAALFISNVQIVFSFVGSITKPFVLIIMPCACWLRINIKGKAYNRTGQLVPASENTVPLSPDDASRRKPNVLAEIAEAKEEEGDDAYTAAVLHAITTIAKEDEKSERHAAAPASAAVSDAKASGDGASAANTAALPKPQTHTDTQPHAQSHAASQSHGYAAADQGHSQGLSVCGWPLNKRNVELALNVVLVAWGCVLLVFGFVIDIIAVA